MALALHLLTASRTAQEAETGHTLWGQPAAFIPSECNTALDTKQSKKTPGGKSMELEFTASTR